VGGGGEVIAGTGFTNCVVAVTASAPMMPGRSRLDLAEANVAICRKLVPRLVEVAPSAIFLFVANPVDVVTYAALRISGLPVHRSSAPAE
jgi:L-lactate dehydrogenase